LDEDDESACDGKRSFRPALVDKPGEANQRIHAGQRVWPLPAHPRDAAGIAHAPDLPRRLSEAPADAPPPSLNLTSMMHHVGTAVSMTFESPHGLVDLPGAFSYLQILDVHHVLVETAADQLLATRPG